MLLQDHPPDKTEQQNPKKCLQGTLTTMSMVYISTKPPSHKSKIHVCMNLIWYTNTLPINCSILLWNGSHYTRHESFTVGEMKNIHKCSISIKRGSIFWTISKYNTSISTHITKHNLTLWRALGKLAANRIRNTSSHWISIKHKFQSTISKSIHNTAKHWTLTDLGNVIEFGELESDPEAAEERGDEWAGTRELSQFEAGLFSMGTLINRVG